MRVSDSLSALQSTVVSSPVDALAPRLRQVVAAASELLAADGVGMLLLDDGDRVRAVAATDRTAELLERMQEHLSVGPGIDALHGAPTTVAVSDIAVDPGYGALWEQVAGERVHAVLSAPIQVAGRVVGNLNALRLEPHVWTPAQVAAAEAFAGVIGQLLELSAASARHLPGGANRDGPPPVPGVAEDARVRA